MVGVVPLEQEEVGRAVANGAAAVGAVSRLAAGDDESDAEDAARGQVPIGNRNDRCKWCSLCQVTSALGGHPHRGRKPYLGVTSERL